MILQDFIVHFIIRFFRRSINRLFESCFQKDSNPPFQKKKKEGSTPKHKKKSINELNGR